MRKIVIAIVVSMLFAFNSMAQVTLEHTNSMRLRPIRFSTHGIKLRLDSNNTIKLYNTDYTLWKRITIPPLAGYPLINPSGLVSDNLFDLDNDLEIFVSYQNSTSSINVRRMVLNEDGSILKDFDSSFSAGSTEDIYNIDGVHKLFLGGSSTMANQTRIYSLVGSLPCGSCGGLGVPKYNNEISGEISSPIPNPNNGSAIINFSLPNGYNSGVITLFDLSGAIIKTYNVDRNSSELQITTSELASGLYYFNLTSNGIEIATKKMVKL